MKKLMMVSAMILMSVNAFAQRTAAIGFNAGVAMYGGTYNYNPFGFGAKFQYEFVEDFRLELGYSYWLPKEEAGLMDFDLNFHYLVPVAYRINFYPLVGINYGMTHGNTYNVVLGGQKTLLGFQGGAGIEGYLTDHLKANLDVKYQYDKKTKNTETYGYEIKYNGPVFQVGLAYVF